MTGTAARHDAGSRYADTTGRAVMECLADYGITAIFGIPGTHNLELYRPLAELGIRAVTNRHEQGSGYGADGWAQRTGLPGVVVTTSGPGLQNVASAIGTAFCESRPLLVISPGAPRGAEFADAGTLHETKDSSAMVAAIAQWSRRVTTAEAAVQAVHDAFELFATGRPRPVHLEIPLDLLEEPAGLPDDARRARGPRARARPEAAEVERAARMLDAAARPVVVAGGGATRAGVPLTGLVERLGAPVLTTLNGKAVVDERHELSLGSNLRLPASRELAEGADVLLVVGSKLGEAELWAPALRARGAVIRIDVSPDQLHRNLPADVALLADSTVALEALLDALGPPAAATLPAPVDLPAVRARIATQTDAADPATAALARDIAAAIPEDAVVAGDSSQVIYLGLGNVLRKRSAHRLLYTPTFATLGYGLPAAIGARVARTDAPVVAVLGDGALMFSVNELATAVEQQLDLTVVCVDNGGYAEIQQNEVDRGIAPVGVVLHQPDWVQLARAFGARGRRVTRQDLPGAIAESIATGGVWLLHLPAGPSSVPGDVDGARTKEET